MKKLKLDPEMLAVESFAPDESADDAIGTVRAHSYVTVDYRPCGGEQSAQCVETDFHWRTCGNSCVYMCFHTGFEAGCAGN
ncbi:MAG TPA: hypothetical protein VLK84_20300 [Longimicrobium sp.]|nr:hypothetical protein [Longimicrobium sp.]